MVGRSTSGRGKSEPHIISVRSHPTRIAITPDGSTAYVVGGTQFNGSIVTPIDLTSFLTAGAEIQTAYHPSDIVITSGRGPVPNRGYYLVASDGGVFAFGSARFYGSTGAMKLNSPVVGMAVTPDDRGYWLVASDGGVFSYGDAKFYGSLGGQHLNHPITAIASTARGGYWLLGAGGGVYAFGKAQARGSINNYPRGVVASAISGTPDGQGYLVVGSNGWVNAIGHAQLQVPPPLSAPEPATPSRVGIATNPHGSGYWIVDADGHTYNYGSAGFHGFDAPTPRPGSVVGTATSDAQGYWIALNDGSVYSYGHAHFEGSLGGHHLNQPIVGIVAVP